MGQGSSASGEGREAGAAYGGSPGGYGGINAGQRFNDGGGYRGGGDPALVERAYRESMRDLGRLRENLGDSPDISRDVTDLMRDMQRIDPRRFGQEPLLMERINAQIASLEQIELQLRRKVDEQQGGNVRSGASEQAPPGYANSIAEYFRKLSKEK